MPQPTDGHEPGLMLTIAGGVAHLVIDRPARKNALTARMWSALADQVREAAAASGVRVLVISGAGYDFSAGADISEFDELRKDAATARDYEAANSAAFAAIRNCAVPTIAAIRGVCFGGGFGIAAACDIRIAADNALFAVPAARLGLAYPQDAMQDIVNACGPQMAKYLTFSAARIGAAKAAEIGFLAEVLADAELDSRAAALAGEIAANAPLSIAASKAAIRAALTGETADIALAQQLGNATFASEDYAEGRAAFREKRAPRFGRSVRMTD
jgi:enoyl-CoA hydratase/carnithine racemase